MKFPEGMRRAIQREIDDAESTAGMRVGLPKAHIGTDKLRYVLAWIAKAEEQMEKEKQ